MYVSIYVWTGITPDLEQGEAISYKTGSGLTALETVPN